MNKKDLSERDICSKFIGPAKVFDREEDAFAAVKARKIQAGDVVVHFPRAGFVVTAKGKD